MAANWTPAQLENLRLESYASDVAYDPEVLKRWSGDRIRAFFANGGVPDPAWTDGTSAALDALAVCTSAERTGAPRNTGGGGK